MEFYKKCIQVMTSNMEKCSSEVMKSISEDFNKIQICVNQSFSNYQTSKNLYDEPNWLLYKEFSKQVGEGIYTLPLIWPAFFINEVAYKVIGILFLNK